MDAVVLPMERTASAKETIVIPFEKEDAETGEIRKEQNFRI